MSAPVAYGFYAQQTTPISGLATGVPSRILKKASEELPLLARKTTPGHFLSQMIGQSSNAMKGKYIRIEQGKCPSGGGCNMQAQMSRLEGKDAVNNKGAKPWGDKSTVAQVVVRKVALKALEASRNYNKDKVQKLIKDAFMKSFKAGHTVEIRVTGA